MNFVSIGVGCRGKADVGLLCAGYGNVLGSVKRVRLIGITSVASERTPPIRDISLAASPRLHGQEKHEQTISNTRQRGILQCDIRPGWNNPVNSSAFLSIWLPIADTASPSAYPPLIANASKRGGGAALIAAKRVNAGTSALLGWNIRRPYLIRHEPRPSCAESR